MGHSAIQAIPATVDALRRLLDARPVLWVGAGASIAAGHPSRAELEAAIREDADVHIAPGLDLPAVADAYVAANGRGPLNRLLDRRLRRPACTPTAFHRAVARLAHAFAAIVTTNCDRLLERALEQAGVMPVVQTLEHNAEIAPDDVRVIKLHGSADDWSTAIVSGQAQLGFAERYAFLVQQLDVLLMQRPIVFVGCSMRHPLVLEWLASCAPERLQKLDRWRPMMTRDSWQRARSARNGRQTATEVFSRARVRPLIVEDYDTHLLELWREVAGLQATKTDGGPARGRLWRVPDLPPHFLPRSEDAGRVIDALLADGSKAVGIAAEKHGLHGMGGIGKSVLAAAVAREQRIREHFVGGIYWLAVGQTPQLTALQAQLGRDLGLQDKAFDSPADGKQHLSDALDRRRVLLILDDVWNIEHAAWLDVIDVRGRLLITTRNLEVLTNTGAQTHALDIMSAEQSAALLAVWAGVDATDLSADALEVADACGRLPLALAIAGALVRKPGGSWARVLRLLQSAKLDKLRGQLPSYPYRTVYQAISASVAQLVDDLGENAEQCYADLAVFAEDEPISAVALEVLWRRHGLDSDDVYELASALADNSLATLQPGIDTTDTWHLRLHDIQRAYVRATTVEPKALHSAYVEAWAQGCRGGFARGPEESTIREQFYARLPYHLVQAGRSGELCELLGSYTWLDGKLRACGVAPLLVDFERIDKLDAQERGLATIRDAVRLSSHVLAREPEQLPGQLTGRLTGPRGQQLEVVRALLEDARTEPTRPWLQPIVPSLTEPGSSLVRTLAGHASSILAVALSADGTHALSGSQDRTLKLWNMQSGTLRHTFEGHASSILSVALSTDGMRALSGSSDRTMKSWNTDTGTLERTFIGHSSSVLSVALSTDGAYALSGSDDRTARLWDVETGALVHSFEGHGSWVNAVALCADGTRALTGSSDRSLKLWNTRTGALVRSLEGHAAAVWAVALSADGTRALSGSRDGTLKLWDVESGGVSRTLTGHQSSVNAVALSADGTRALSGSSDRTLKLWDISKGILLRTFVGYAHWVNAVALSANGALAVSGSKDPLLRLWNTTTSATKMPFEGQLSPVDAVALSADGRRAVSGSKDHGLQLWDTTSGTIVRSLVGHSSSVNAVAMTANGRRALSGSSDRTARWWDTGTGALLHTFEGHTSWINAVAVSSDGGRALSGSKDNSVKVWDPEAKALVHTLEGHTSWVNAVAASADGALAISGSNDRTVRIWNTTTGALLGTLLGHSSTVNAVALNAEGTLAISGSDDRTLKLWDVARRTLICTFVGHSSAVHAVALSADGRTAFSGSDDRSLLVWDTATGQRVASLTTDTSIRACARSSEGPLLLAAGARFGRLHLLRLMNRG